MWYCAKVGFLAVFFGAWSADVIAAGDGDPDRGRQAFRACAACHSLAPGRHMTGPSLAGIWGRKAAGAEGFTRYSAALAGSGLVWDEATLDRWIADPGATVPGNRMNFRGLPDAAERRDLIAFLRRSTQAAQAAPNQEPPGGEGAPGAMRGADRPDLARVPAGNRVAAIGYCGDTYTVTTEAGERHAFWEFNLRFKTDGSERGPAADRPVLIPGGMMGDRAFVVFAEPGEISAFIKTECPQ